MKISYHNPTIPYNLPSLARPVSSLLILMSSLPLSLLRSAEPSQTQCFPACRCWLSPGCLNLSPSPSSSPSTCEQKYTTVSPYNQLHSGITMSTSITTTSTSITMLTLVILSELDCPQSKPPL